MKLNKYALSGLLIVLVIAGGGVWLANQGRSAPTAPPNVTLTATPGETPAMTAAPATATPTPEIATPTAPVSIPVGVDDVPMVEVPAGEFLMGSTAVDVIRWEKELPVTTGYWDYTRDEWPQMVVYLDTFEIDQVEVTYAHYLRCAEAGVCTPPSQEFRENHPDLNESDYPARVKLSDAHAYCKWVNKRLPTEMEWEKAARGTDGRIYPWGNEWDETRLYMGRSMYSLTTVPVGSYPQGASPYGALDMVGNAGEWVAGTYDVYPGGLYTQTSTQGYSGAVAYRGGYSGALGTDSPPRLQYRAANRFRADVGSLGFRCVRGPEPPPLSEALVSSEDFAEPTPLAQVDLSGMVEIPAGESLMGSDESEAFPLHTVYLDAFYMDQYETTSVEYAEFLNALGATYFACDDVTCTDLELPSYEGKPNHIFEQDGRFIVETGYENYPAVAISWQGADAYCRWRGKRLPTDAEWEKAARGAEGYNYPWGNQIEEWPPCSYYSAGRDVPIGDCPEDVSPYKLWDMRGSVKEWVSDWYDPEYYKNIPYRNPAGPELPATTQYARIIRPGASFPLYNRDWKTGKEPCPYAGVRCAYTP